MNIALLTTSFPEQGYTSRGPFIKRLYDALEEEGVQVTVVFPKGYHALKEHGGIFPALHGSLINKLLFCAYTLHFTLLIPFRARKTDLIHANWSYTAFLALLTRWIHHKKIVLTERGPEIVYTKNPLIKTVVRFVYTHVDALVTISSSIAEEIKTIYHIQNITVIPNGVERPSHTGNKTQLRKQLGIPQTQFVFLSAGRLIKRKAIDQLLIAFQKLPSGHLYIVGDGPERASLVHLTKTLNLTGRVHFTGEVSPSAIFSWMRAADVFVFPSLMETGGNVLLEAAASGLPIITTNVGWARDVVIPDKNGFIINPHDTILGFSHAMRTLLNNPSLCHTYSTNSQTFIKNTFQWDTCAQSYIHLYTTTL